MPYKLKPQEDVPQRTPIEFVLFLFLSFLAAWTALRAVLIWRFLPPPFATREMAEIMWEGLRRDAFVALVFVVPVVVWFTIVPQRWYIERWLRSFFWLLIAAAAFLQVALLGAEYWFFDQYRGRFNSMAVEKALHPQETLTSLREHYPLPWILAAMIGITSLWLLLAKRRYTSMWLVTTPILHRLGLLVLTLGLAWGVATSFDLKGVSAGSDPAMNEIANNGPLSLGVSVWTDNRDYPSRYQTLPVDEATRRARRLLTATNSQFVGGDQSLRRALAGDDARPRLNVVIVIAESLGSEFWGALGRTTTLTPEMDRWAAAEGLLFTGLRACDTTTAQCLEGLLASRPPLPAQPTYRQEPRSRLETLAHLLKRDGYSTLFLYGGPGSMDGVAAFAERAGYDRFVGQRDFVNPTFSTPRGVCDEDLFGRAIEELRALHQQGRPFLGTILTVSNQKPYTYPKGRIKDGAALLQRADAVKYADHSLGKFLATAREEAFWTNTIFAVVADHGADQSGAMRLPLRSDAIPLLILGPAAVKGPAHIATLGSSLDVSPTLMGLLGRPYEAMFFGRDLLNDPPDQGRALAHHNRGLGLLTPDRLAILWPNQKADLYAGNLRKGELKPISKPLPEDLEVTRDCAALFQIAHSLRSGN